MGYTLYLYRKDNVISEYNSSRLVKLLEIIYDQNFEPYVKYPITKDIANKIVKLLDIIISYQIVKNMELTELKAYLEDYLEEKEEKEYWFELI